MVKIVYGVGEWPPLLGPHTLVEENCYDEPWTYDLALFIINMDICYSLMDPAGAHLSGWAWHPLEDQRAVGDCPEALWHACHSISCSFWGTLKLKHTKIHVNNMLYAPALSKFHIKPFQQSNLEAMVDPNLQCWNLNPLNEWQWSLRQGWYTHHHHLGHIV